MSKRNTNLLIIDILDSISKVNRYCAGFDFDNFLKDEKTIDAVIRNFEIIGEAANQIPKSFQIENPQIDWSGLISFRNRLIHGYFGVDLEILWNIYQFELPTIEKQFSEIKTK